MTKDRDRILVLGAGYVGLVTAVGMASLGRDVDIVELDPRRHALLERGVVPIHEAGLQAGFDRPGTRHPSDGRSGGRHVGHCVRVCRYPDR